MKTAVLIWVSALALVGVANCTPEEGTEPEPVTPTKPKTGDDAALVPPATGKGFQMETNDTQVPPGKDYQDCYFFKVSELAKKGGLDPTKPVNLHRVHTAYRPGSHHMNIFRVRTLKDLDPKNGLVQHSEDGVGACFTSSNWSDWPLIANSQQDGQLDWTYPDGVANVLEPDEWIMLQTHYVNAATQKTESTGKVRVNFHSIPKEEVKAELGTIFATKQSIRICESNPKQVYEGTCQIDSPNPVHIIGANGHFHSRGRQFDMYTWDGLSAETPADKARFYQSKSWDDPPMLRSPELDVTVPKGGGIWYSCSFEWQMPPAEVGGCQALNAYDKEKGETDGKNLDCCYTFGGRVDLSEHCNSFIYYYPKQDNVNCF